MIDPPFLVTRIDHEAGVAIAERWKQAGGNLSILLNDFGLSQMVREIIEAALVVLPAERDHTKRDVLDFPDDDSMVAAIMAGGRVEAPLDGNPRWTPTEADML